MGYEPDRHHRRSIRLAGFDYRSVGAYFITICTSDRACVFGAVRDGVVRLSRRGTVAERCWRDIPNHRPSVDLDEFIVMPNHTHGIAWICGGAPGVEPSDQGGTRLLAGSLGAIVGSYKAAVSREINKLRPGAAHGLWQPNYFEHIIRNDHSLGAIREYIRTNPERWGQDRENPDADGTDDFEAFVRRLASEDGSDV